MELGVQIEVMYDFLFLNGIHNMVLGLGLQRKALLCAVGMTRKRNRKALMGEWKTVFAAPPRREAIHPFKVRKKHWGIEKPGALSCLGKNLRECLTYYDCSRRYWKHIRTANVFERSFREI